MSALLSMRDAWLDALKVEETNKFYWYTNNETGEFVEGYYFVGNG